MKKTTNFKLNAWEKGDRIMMEDFNRDNQTLDGELARQRDEMVALTAAMALKGNCEIVYGSYVGNGSNSNNPPCTLTFDHKPLLLAVLPEFHDGDSPHSLLAVRGSGFVYTYQEYYASENAVTWGERSVSWRNKTASYQFNSSGRTYHYVALLAADE